MNQTSGRGSGMKILLGLTIGCGTLVLLFFVMVFAVGYWAYMPGDQVATSTILGEESVAFLRVQSLGKDPGVTQMMETVILEARRAEQQEVPVLFRWLMDRQVRRSKKEAGQVREMLAREITVTLEAVPGQTDPGLVVAVNLSRFSRLIKFVWWLASDPDHSPQVNDEPQQMAFVENTMILAPPSLLPRVTARVEGRAEQVYADLEIIRAYQSANPRWDVHGMALNRGGAYEYLSRVLRSGREDLAEETPPLSLDLYRSVRNIRFGVDVVSDDEIEAQITVDSDDPEQARKIVDQVLDAFKQAVSDPQNELRLESALDQGMGKTVLSVRIANLRQALIRAIRGRRDAEMEADER